VTKRGRLGNKSVTIARQFVAMKMKIQLSNSARQAMTTLALMSLLQLTNATPADQPGTGRYENESNL